MTRAWDKLRRDPLLLLLVLLAIALPPVLGLVPFDRALAPLLDLRPLARSIGGAPLDDSIVTDIFMRAPALHGVLSAGVLVALALAGPAVWLVEAGVAAAMLDVRALRWAYGRGLAIMLFALPLRLLPMGVAALIVWSAHTQLWGALRNAIIAAAILYTLLSALLTVLIDLARGHALGKEEPLHRALVDAVGSARRDPELYARLVALELASFGVGVAVLALTRPLGMYHGALLALGTAALVLRALVIALTVATAALMTRPDPR